MCSLALPRSAHLNPCWFYLVHEDSKGSRNFANTLVWWQNLVLRPFRQRRTRGWGWGQTWVSGLPALLHVLPPRTTKDLGLQFLHGLSPSLPWGPQPSAGLLDTDCRPTGGKRGTGRGPPSLSCPAHTQSPLSLDTRDQLRPLLSIHGHPASMGRPVPGASSRPPGPAQSGALTRFLPKDARVCGPALNHRYKLRSWCFIQTPKSSPHFYRERRSLL